MRLVEKEGPQALTLRRLGDALGVDATALYRHFRNKVDTFVVEMEQLAAKLVDIVHGERAA